MRVLREAFLDIRRNLTKGLLAAIGLTLAVLAVLSIVVAGSISRQVVVATSEQKYGRQSTVAGEVTMSDLSLAKLRDDIAYLDSALSNQRTAYALTISTGAVLNGGLVGPSDLTLVAGSLDGIRRIPLLTGRWLPHGSTAYPAGLLVNEAARRSLGGVGTSLSIRPIAGQASITERVVGVVADGNSEPDVFASLYTTIVARPSVLASQPVTLTVHSRTLALAALTQEFNAALSALGFDPASSEAQEVDQVAGVRADVATLQIAFLAVASIALLVAIAGLLSIGIATVTERERELTIRRALGATRTRVATLVLLNNVAIGALAATFAVAVGELLLTAVVPRVLPSTLEIVAPRFPWTAAGLGFTLAITASLISGVIPAVRASRTDLATALRA